jgi:hypothetical protein
MRPPGLASAFAIGLALAAPGTALADEPAPAAPSTYPPPGYQVEPDPPTSAAPARARRLATLIEVGAAARDLYNLGFYGGQLGLSFGADYERLSLRGHVQGGYASTSFGLAAVALRYGFSVEGRFERFRFGGGPLLGSHLVRRITNGTFMSDLSLSPELHFTWDAALFDAGGGAAAAHRVRGDRGFYIGVRAVIDFLLYSTTRNTAAPVAPELELFVGVRL